MKVSVIKYNAGNIQSVLFALKRINIEATVTDDHEEIMSSDKVIFPGVGEAGSAMKYLNEKKLTDVIAELNQPVLGICLGMQLLCRYSEENNTTCIGVFDDVEIKKFNNKELRVPQIGWNSIQNLSGPLFNDIDENSYCYFVHGYFAELCSNTIARTEYGSPYSSAIQKNNFYGVQFHPEKSAETGETILKNFFNL
ncbi:MAG: imidazole glycerol phosphate synthase subunit HisH [Chitinophagaceae bacterium]|nr:imidazole glycerol phosphate synthase subunit HisH [Chitinophagaceae bacterium]MCB9055896.1 imidazole glycerol phosphate synthase subunit HisH [Chitinophagales bacterium]